jgi:tetratricopeptide (TPR) repeat protein
MKYKSVLLCVFAAVLITLGLSSCALKTADDKTLLLYARARSLYEDGRFAETTAALSRKNAGVKTDFFVPALVLRGKAEFFSGDAASAEKTFRRILFLRPAQTEASLYLASVLREMGNDRDAKKIVEGLLADDPANIRALRLAASLNAGGGAETGAAMAFLDRAADICEEAALVLLDRARLLWIGGRHTEALSDLRRAKVIARDGGELLRVITSLENTIMEKSL